MTREMGKVLNETRGDVQEAIDAAYYNAGEGRRMFGPTVPSELPNKFAMAVRQPIGVCGMITPWNFPMAISSWKLLPAIVCGNTCVIKPAQDTPLSTFNLVRALTDAGVPKGVINIVAGFGPEVGTPLVEHPDVRAISLTGSSAVGRIVGTTAAKSFKHCSLELGGKNPMIVLDDANLELAIEGGLWGGFGTTGQRCTATSRIIVQKGVYREFIERYVERAKKLKVGNGLDETVEMGPAINEKQLKTDLSYVDIGKNEGAKLMCGGNRLDQGDYQHGWFMEPTVFTDVDPKMRIAQEEIFGPVVSIIPCDDLEDAIEIANGIEYGLSSCALHQRREQGVRRHARPLRRHHLHQRSDDRRRSPSALRRHQSHRQRPSRRRHRRDRFLHRVEGGLRRLFGQAAESADRSRGVKSFHTGDQKEHRVRQSVRDCPVILCAPSVQDLVLAHAHQPKPAKSPPPPASTTSATPFATWLASLTKSQAGTQSPPAERRRSAQLRFQDSRAHHRGRLQGHARRQERIRAIARNSGGARSDSRRSRAQGHHDRAGCLRDIRRKRDRRSLHLRAGQSRRRYSHAHARIIRSTRPCYASSGFALNAYYLNEEDGWQPELADIERKITPRTRAIVLINPNNPTGSVCSRQMLEQIAELARSTTWWFSRTKFTTS